MRREEEKKKNKEEEKVKRIKWESEWLSTIWVDEQLYSWWLMLDPRWNELAVKYKVLRLSRWYAASGMIVSANECMVNSFFMGENNRERENNTVKSYW